MPPPLRRAGLFALLVAGLATSVVVPSTPAEASTLPRAGRVLTAVMAPVAARADARATARPERKPRPKPAHARHRPSRPKRHAARPKRHAVAKRAARPRHHVAAKRVVKRNPSIPAAPPVSIPPTARAVRTQVVTPAIPAAAVLGWAPLWTRPSVVPRLVRTPTTTPNRVATAAPVVAQPPRDASIATRPLHPVEARAAAVHHAAAHRPAARRAHRAAHRPSAAYRLPARRSPGSVTDGHYIRSLTGHPAHDRSLMRTLGARDAARNASGSRHLVLLDIGGQVPGGVFLSTTHRFISNPALVRAVGAYVAGYRSRQHTHAPVTIAIGTNNDIGVSTAYGRSWARDVVEPVRRAATGVPQMVIAGADDIEPGFRAGPPAVRAWLNGYLSSTRAPFVFNGSADGCSGSRPLSHCLGAWTAKDLSWFAGAAAPSRIEALPQIYNATMAGQWAQISLTSRRTHHPAVRFAGPLTENVACGRDPACPTMPSRRAWALLWRDLYRAGAPVRQTNLPVQVDLDVN